MRMVMAALCAASVLLGGCSDSGETQTAAANQSSKGDAFRQFAINSLFGSIAGTADASEANHKMAQNMKANTRR